MSSEDSPHPITLLAHLPYRNDPREWARLTATEQTTLDKARDAVAPRVQVEDSQIAILLAAYRRLAGHNPDGGDDEVTT